MTTHFTTAILLMGPTAAGKTDLAIELAQRHPVELISVDSALVYRGMDIGTGKPSPALLQQYPHHLVNILDPCDSYSTGQFVRDVCGLIGDIHARGRVPLLVGGTMLYFRALTKGIAAMPEANPEFRTELEARALQVGWPALHTELAERDPLAAQRIGPNDAQRIQRALEVMALTGRSMSSVQADTRPPLPGVKFVAIGLNPGDREILYARIKMRFNDMINQGFLDEVRRLYERGDLHAQLPAIRAVGYRQLWQYLAGVCSLDEAIQQGILATRHLARRQLMWMRAEPALHWVDSLAADALMQCEQKIVGGFR
ncbi:MAG: tRNA (adenosine(37)-N6)-dimethylallyltransferase MiaA [Steroidobacteraceae bacterium]